MQYFEDRSLDGFYSILTTACVLPDDGPDLEALLAIEGGDAEDGYVPAMAVEVDSEGDPGRDDGALSGPYNDAEDEEEAEKVADQDMEPLPEPSKTEGPCAVREDSQILLRTASRAVLEPKSAEVSNGAPPSLRRAQPCAPKKLFQEDVPDPNQTLKNKLEMIKQMRPGSATGMQLLSCMIIFMFVRRELERRLAAEKVQLKGCSWPIHYSAQELQGSVLVRFLAAKVLTTWTRSLGLWLPRAPVPLAPARKPSMKRQERSSAHPPTSPRLMRRIFPQRSPRKPSRLCLRRKLSLQKFLRRRMSRGTSLARAKRKPRLVGRLQET